MKNLFTLIALFVTTTLSAQWLKPNNSYGTIQNRIALDSAFAYPTGCGAPVLKAVDLKKSAFFYDTCGSKLWVYDPKQARWFHAQDSAVKCNDYFDEDGPGISNAAGRVDNILYNLIDDYTGEAVTFEKITGLTDADVDGVLIRKKGTEYFKRVYNGPADVRWWGADPKGITEATSKLQNAINSGVDLQAKPGDTYLIAPLIANRPGQQIHFNNSTLKLKAGSGSFMLKVTAKNVIVDGGIFDGNKGAGMVTGDFGYDHAAVSVEADSATVQNITSINSYGFGVKGVGSNITVQNCKIYNHTLSGVYIEPAGPGTANMLRGNRIINNVIDAAGGLGGGIYLVSFVDGTLPTWYQTGWVISGNTIRCATGGWPDEAHAPSCIYPRAQGGIISNNTLYGGYFGITEGGPGTVINGNRIETRGDSSYTGIEVHFSNNIISNNYIKGFYFDILSSGTAVGSNCSITGNNILNWRNAGIHWQADPSLHANNLNFSGNIFKKDTAGGNVAIYLTYPVQHVNITANTFKGNNNGGGAGVLLERTKGEASITNNVFGGFSELVACYAAVPDTFNNILFSFNELSDNTDFAKMTTGGSGVMGTGIIEAFNSKNGFTAITYDRKKDIGFNIFDGNPEGLLIRGPGSLTSDLNGGLYVKETGTDVLGWQKFVTTPSLNAFVKLTTDQTIYGKKTFKDIIAIDSGDISYGHGLAFGFDAQGGKIQSFAARPLYINKSGNPLTIGNWDTAYTLNVGGDAAIKGALYVGSTGSAGSITLRKSNNSISTIISSEGDATRIQSFDGPLDINPTANDVLINGVGISKPAGVLTIGGKLAGSDATLANEFHTKGQHDADVATLQAAINLKAPLANPHFTGLATLNGDTLLVNITGKLRAGLNTSITGGGTSANPYVINTNGGHVYVIDNADYEIQPGERTLILPPTTATRYLTLPAASINTDREIRVVCNAAADGNWVLTGSYIPLGSTTFTEVSSQPLLAGKAYEFVSDGVHWYNVGL
jgi:hypothetical protein